MRERAMKSQEIRELIDRGDAYERSGLWAQAEEHWQSLLADSALLFWGKMRLGGVYYAQSRFADAIEILHAAVALNPAHPYAQEMLLRSTIQRDGFVSDLDFINHGLLSTTEYSWVKKLTDGVALLKTRGLIKSDVERPVYSYIDHDTPIYDVAAHDGSIPALLNIGAHSVALPGDWDLLGTRFEEFEVHRAIDAVLVAGACEWKDTDFYKSIVARIQAGDHVWGCESETAFETRLAKDMPQLLRNISANGVLPQSQLGGWDPMDDIRLGVGRDGDLIFLNGQHRLAMAKLLRLKRIPVRIVVRHAQWESLRKEIEAYRSSAGNGYVYQQIPHADLVDVPAVHKLERFAAILDSVKDLNPGSKVMLDIGSHWGAVPVIFSRLGFRCDAVENNPEYLPFLRKFTSFRDAHVHLIEGNVFDLSDFSKYDVIIALNILHHFLRTEQSFASLKTLLGRIRRGVMFVQTHNPETVDGIDGYFAPMTVVQFLDFILGHSVFTSYTEIYRETDGRPVYLFS